MQTEIEAKFPNVDPTDIRTKLAAAGATMVHPEILMRRNVFDFPDGRLEKIGGWARVRDEGSKVTMSYKQLNDRSLHGTVEATVTVSDYDQACAIFRGIGLESYAYQETKRELWKLGDVEVTIDTWPWIPSFVELEGPSEDAVRSAATVLGFDWATAMHGSVETVYQMHYDFTEAEIDHWPEITFIPEPDWLLVKKR